MKTVLFALVVVAYTILPTSVSGAQSLDDVTVRIEPRSSSVVLGANLDLRVEVTNNGSSSTPAVVVHIDITDPAKSTSVDPEDWTATLSKPIGAVGAGQTVAVDWNIQPISPGADFAVYAVVLASESETIAVSDVLSVEVIDQRTLDPGGILPVAIGAPLIVGGLLLWRVVAPRHRSNPSLAPT